jgi:hypothetical protein
MSSHCKDLNGEWRYRPDSAWSKRALATPLGATHGGVALDREGNIYCCTDGTRSVIVFNHDGDPLRQFDPRWAGMHALQVVTQAGEEFLLGTHLAARRIVMLTMSGKPLWSLGAPMESGFYQSDEAFQPTAATIAPDGCLFVADGYGASVVHQFDAERKYIRSFGGAEAGEGQLRNCHGLTLDSRGPQPRLLICDRRNHRHEHYDLAGNFAGVVAGNLRRPCGVALSGHHLAVAELEGRVTILDRNNSSLAVIGDNPDPEQRANYDLPPAAWNQDILIAPHAVCFDPHGNLFVSEWNASGRLSKFVLRAHDCPHPPPHP